MWYNYVFLLDASAPGSPLSSTAPQEAFDTMAAQKGREGRRKSDPKIQLILDRRTSETWEIPSAGDPRPGIRRWTAVTSPGELAQHDCEIHGVIGVIWMDLVIDG